MCFFEYFFWFSGCMCFFGRFGKFFYRVIFWLIRNWFNVFCLVEFGDIALIINDLFFFFIILIFIWLNNGICDSSNLWVVLDYLVEYVGWILDNEYFKFFIGGGGLEEFFESCFKFFIFLCFRIWIKSRFGDIILVSMVLKELRIWIDW